MFETVDVSGKPDRKLTSHRESNIMNSSKNEQALRTIKKRYIAIAALAALAVTGGVVGATVTENSTMAGNKITVKTAADVTVEGTPMDISWTVGEDLGQGAESQRTYTVKNTGETDAVVDIKGIKDLNLPQQAGKTDSALVRATVDGKIVFEQKFQGSFADAGNPDKVTSATFKVPGKGQVVVNAFYEFPNGTKSFLSYNPDPFDLAFNFISDTAK